MNLNQRCMGIILWTILGALAGWVASIIMRTNAEQGIVGNIVVGVIGAVLGGFIMNLVGQMPVTGFNIYSFLVALLGAVILLAIVKAVRGNGTTTT